MLSGRLIWKVILTIFGSSLQFPCLAANHSCKESLCSRCKLGGKLGGRLLEPSQSADLGILEGLVEQRGTGTFQKASETAIVWILEVEEASLSFAGTSASESSSWLVSLRRDTEPDQRAPQNGNILSN